MGSGGVPKALHVLEVAVEHESDKVHPFRFEYIDAGVGVWLPYGWNGDEFPYCSLKCPKVGRKRRTD